MSSDLGTVQNKSRIHRESDFSSGLIDPGGSRDSPSELVLNNNMEVTDDDSIQSQLKASGKLSFANIFRSNFSSWSYCSDDYLLGNLDDQLKELDTASGDIDMDTSSIPIIQISPETRRRLCTHGQMFNWESYRSYCGL